MAAHETQISHEMLLSNLSLPLPVQMLGGLAAAERYTQAIGADGIELTPSNRGRLMSVIHGRHMGLDFSERENQYPESVFAEGSMAAAVARHARNRDWLQTDMRLTSLIRSYHASPRDATTPKFDLLGRIMFPHFEESFGTMLALQQVTGPRPGVVFPYYDDKRIDYENYNLGLSVARFQPKPMDWRRMGLADSSPATDVLETMNDNRFGEITWDAFHSQNEQGGVTFAEPLELCRRLAAAGLIGSFHLALDRQDCAPKGSPLADSTRQAKEAFVKSEAAARATIEGEMLTEVARQWGQWATETQRSVVVEVLPGRSTKQSASEHAKIIEHARAIIAAA